LIGIARQERQRPCLGRLAIDKLLSFLNDVRRILEHRRDQERAAVSG